jgi:cbb3-type cytochrome oxidase subunit 3
MIKDTLSHMDMAALTTAGLVLFFVVFVGVTLYATTRHRRQADQWARIPLTAEPQDARCPSEE